MGTMNTDESRQINAGNGVYEQSARAKAAVSGAQSAGAGSSVVHLDGGSGSGDKSSQAQKEIQPNKPDAKRVDGVKNPAGDGKKPVGNNGQTGTPDLSNATSINDRKV